MFEISIDQFSGPLDLMLFLIKEKKLDLFNLDIAELTMQYQHYITSMQQMNLEIASEYLSELAGLIEYKSKKLLPRDKSMLDADYKEDPKESLVRRLLEYQAFKDITSNLESRYQMRQQFLSKPLSRKEVEDVMPDMLVEGSSYDLIRAMKKVMVRISLQQPFETKIAERELSVDQRIDMLRRMINRFPSSFALEECFADCPDIQLVLITFLAVLDMIRIGELLFTVEGEQIYLIRSTSDDGFNGNY
ncbi:MAG: segregation/condensation protein A [Erysipelothrix sp.]|nr:segregation/condensation protein A [Erysipelothrix sp.]